MPGLRTPRLPFIAAAMAARKTGRGFESQAETGFPQNCGDPRYSGLGASLS